jgi:transposase
MASIFNHERTDFKEVLKNYAPSQILYVSIDVAKYNHSAMIVDFGGDIITPKFDFPYNHHGIQFLHHKIRQAQQHTHAQKLFLGLEATGHYHENLTLHLQSMDYDVHVIRPLDVFRERDNVHAKTDAIDLAAIARVLITQKGKRSYVPDDIYYNLQRASRTHRQLTWQETRTKNIITTLIDRIFPGLWRNRTQSNAIFSDPWGKASLLLIEHYPAPQKVLKLGAQRLAAFFKKHNTKLGIQTANKIIQAARNAPMMSTQRIASDLKALQAHLAILKILMTQIEDHKRQMATFLIQTPGLYLLSIPGVSIVYAADFTAEVGNIQRFAYAKQISSLAGTCPRAFQSGQVDLHHLPASHKGKDLLRMTLNQIALSLHTHCPAFTQYYDKKRMHYQDTPGKARTATANKFIRLAFALMKQKQLYNPHTQNPLLPEKQYYQDLWKKVKQKLQPYLPNNLSPESYLHKLQRQLEEEYGITS